MHFGIKVTIVAIIAGMTALNGLTQKQAEADLVLNKLAACGLDVDGLSDIDKDELVNMSEAELYQVCESSLRTQEILRMQQDLMNNLNSININN